MVCWNLLGLCCHGSARYSEVIHRRTPGGGSRLCRVDQMHHRYRKTPEEGAVHPHLPCSCSLHVNGIGEGQGRGEPTDIHVHVLRIR